MFVFSKKLALILMLLSLTGCAFRAFQGGSSKESSLNCQVDVQLAWDPPASSDGSPQFVLGYQVYHGFVSRGYDQVVESKIDGSEKSPTFWFRGIPAGKTSFFAVTAYNSSIESPYSNEVSINPASCDKEIFLNLGNAPIPKGVEQ